MPRRTTPTDPSRHPSWVREPTWRSVEVDGARVEVMEAGEGDPLLFLHGWGLTPRSYAAGITRLTAAGIRVIAPSLPGFGHSDGPPLRSIDLSTYARRVDRLLDVLEVQTPVFVAGHSFGAGIALQLASERPERVRALTLVNSVGGAPGTRSGLVDASWWQWFTGAVRELDKATVLRAAPTMVRDFLPSALRKPVTLALTARLALTASLADEARALVDAGLPVLFVWGDDDRLILPGALAQVAGSLPAEVVEGNHGWLLSRPEEFGTLLHNALVVHAMLERKELLDHRVGGSRPLVLPAGQRLADLLPDHSPVRRLRRPGA